MDRTAVGAVVMLAVSLAVLANIPSRPPTEAKPAISPTAAVQPSASETASAESSASPGADGADARLPKADPAYRTLRPAPYSWVSLSTIAHGMGGLEGKRVTNSLEAFDANYKNGYRLFEVDLVESTDGRLVARHDWNAYLYEFLGQKIDNPYRKLSTDEFKSLRMHGKYTPLTIDDVVALMRAYPDVWIMTDTKGTTKAEAQAAMKEIVRAIGDDEVLADRFIVQIYNEPMLNDVREIHPFKNIVYTLYQLEGTPQRAIEFAAEKRIKVLAIPDTMWSESLVTLARESGLKVALYTVNDKKAAKRYRDSGVALLYSDFLPAED